MAEEIFESFDKSKKGYLDVQELINGMVFFLRGKFEYKMALYFEVNMLNDKNLVVPKETLIKLLKECLILYNEVFDSSKKIADVMNVKLDGKIKFDEFRGFCEQFPSAMDFLGRLTIGDYPYAISIEEKLKSAYENESMGLLAIENGNLLNLLSNKID